MMIVVEPQGLALVPWDKMAGYLILGVTYFFKFFIIGESFQKKFLDSCTKMLTVKWVAACVCS